MQENNQETPKKNFRPRKKLDNKERKDQVKKTLEEKVITVNRVTKVVKGGRQFRFSATVVVGNRKGKVGLGTGKAAEVSEAVKKARQDANKNVVRIPIIDGRTIPHEVVGIKGATRVIIKPAKEGTGLIAGGAVRSVLEIAGYRDITSKSLGSRKKINVARATISALQSLKTAEQVAEARGKSVEEILG